MSADSTPALALPFILPAQAQKHVTHNEALEILDTVVQLAVLAFDAATPPSAPQEGDTHALGNAPTGDWSGHARSVATYAGGGWLFIMPQDGWIATGPGGDIRLYSGSAWVDARNRSMLQNLPALGIATSADATNRLAVAGEATLLTHAGGSHRIKLNKAASAQTASILFQSDWSGRAEVGLCGNNSLAVKVSADGATWTTAIAVEGSGTVGIGQALRLTPSTAPAGATAGTIYFDSAAKKLRCHDGTTWQDLF